MAVGTSIGFESHVETAVLIGDHFGTADRCHVSQPSAPSACRARHSRRLVRNAPMGMRFVTVVLADQSKQQGRPVLALLMEP